MSINDFLQKCTACGGNWVAMLLSGIKEVFPSEYESVVKGVEEIGYGAAGTKSFAYVCDWLEKHGVTAEL